MVAPNPGTILLFVASVLIGALLGALIGQVLIKKIVEKNHHKKSRLALFLFMT